MNRNIIGAVVGVQPFGGEALSGTGPARLAARTTCTVSVRNRRWTVNTAAAGGNAALLAGLDTGHRPRIQGRVENPSQGRKPSAADTRSLQRADRVFFTS